MKRLLIIVGLLLCAVSSHAANGCPTSPAFARCVQAWGSLTAASGTTAATGNSPVAVTSGNLIVVYSEGSGAATVITFAGSGGTYANTEASPIRASAGTGLNGQLAYVCGAAAGTEAITATYTVAQTNRRIWAVELSGAATSSCFDTHSGGTSGAGSSTALDSGNTATLAQAAELIVGYATSDAGVTSAGNLCGSAATLVFTQNSETSNGFVNTSGTTACKATWTNDGGTSSAWIALIATFKDAATSTLTQAHFRARNDDGSETTATWYANEDAAFTAPLNTNLRLRSQITTSGDTPTSAKQLEWKKSTDADAAYRKVDVAPSQVVYTICASGCTSTTNFVAPNDVTTATVECWGGGGAGARAAANSIPGGGGKGGSYAKVNAMPLTPGTTYTPTIGIGGVSSTAAAGGATDFIGDSATHCTAAGGVTPAVSSTTGATTVNGTSVGDVTNAGGNGANGSGTNAGGGGEAGGSSGIGAAGSGASGGSGVNADGGDGGPGRTGTNGVGTGGTAPAGAGGGALRVSTTSNNGGAGAPGKVQITYTATPAIVLAASANITAGGGDATTRQLTTCTMHTGHMSDDTNPLATTDIATSECEEDEWNLQAVSPAVNGNIYYFRVTKAGVVLDIYSVTPQWTIGTASTNYNASLAAAVADSPAVAIVIGRKAPLAISAHDSPAFSGNVAATVPAAAAIHFAPTIAVPVGKTTAPAISFNTSPAFKGVAATNVAAAVTLHVAPAISPSAAANMPATAAVHVSAGATIIAGHPLPLAASVQDAPALGIVAGRKLPLAAATHISPALGIVGAFSTAPAAAVSIAPALAARAGRSLSLPASVSAAPSLSIAAQANGRMAASLNVAPALSIRRAVQLNIAQSIAIASGMTAASAAHLNPAIAAHVSPSISLSTSGAQQINFSTATAVSPALAVLAASHGSPSVAVGLSPAFRASIGRNARTVASIAIAPAIVASAGKHAAPEAEVAISPAIALVARRNYPLALTASIAVDAQLDAAAAAGSQHRRVIMMGM